MDSAEFDYKLRQVKLLSCIFLTDVSCLYRKDDNFRLMDRCLKCRHYRRFMHEMAEDDERSMDEIDRIREHGYDAVG